MDHSQEMLDLLQKIEHSSRRQARLGMLQTFLTLLCCVFCGGVLILVLQILPQVQTVLQNLEQVTAQLAEADLAGMAADMNTLMTTGQDSLQQAMTKLNSIDIDVLNQAIADLSAVVEPLAKFFNAFR